MSHAKYLEEDLVRPLAPREFEQFRKLAYQTFGLDLKDGKQELVSARLRKLVKAAGLRTYEEYYRHVESDRTGEALAGMIDALTTNHTTFMREPDHFAFLKEEIVPKLQSRPRIEVWSAACSTGEEVWTLAFLLDEAVPGKDIKLYGSDISNRVLAKARAGLYPAERTTGVPQAWCRRYLTKGSGDTAAWYQVAPAFRNKAEFRRINLLEPISWPRPFPVIFCRNVMIYFDKKTQERVVVNLSAHLEPGGYLFIGHAESLTGVRHDLEYVRPAVYRRPAKGVR